MASRPGVDVAPDYRKHTGCLVKGSDFQIHNCERTWQANDLKNAEAVFGYR